MSRLPKTTKKQYEELFNFVSLNRIVLTGKTKPLEHKKIESLWKDFAEDINKKSFGSPKTVQQWRHVFKEWKANTKRKSRFIELGRNRTGGGPATNKTLTDLEEKLLALISKIHLGDTELPDTFTTNDENLNIDDEPWLHNEHDHTYVPHSSQIPPEETESNSSTGYAAPIDYVSFEIEAEEPEEIAIDGNNSNNTQKTPITVTNDKGGSVGTKRKQKVNSNTLSANRYTSNLLRTVTENFMNAQQLNVANEQLKAESLHKLNDAFNVYIDAYKATNDIEMCKLELDRKRNKLEYYQIFGTVEGYDEF